MKKTVSVLLSVIMAALLLLPAFTVYAAADTAIAVVTGAEATETEKYAAQALSDYLGQITGGEYPVLTVEDSFDGYKFYVGVNAAPDTNALEGKADGSYIIEPVKDGCAIFGAGNRGTIYGVFGYLEKYCGYSCFTAERGMTTDAEEITFPEEKTEYNAYFEYTDTDWHSPRDNLYSVANGLNGRPYRDIPAEMGGTVAYISGFCHTLTMQFCSAGMYFDEHPEYFAVHDGERTERQLCLTNPDTVEVVRSEVLALLEEKHDPDAAMQIISLTQNDNTSYCECKNCKALDDENGSHAGTMINFVNQIADAVKEAGYDNVAIDTFAYQYTRACPTAVIPRDNVIVRLCTIECCFTHPIEDGSCEQNVKLMQDLENWSKICDRIYVWDYTTNYAYTASVFPDFHVLQANIKTFYEHGVKGVYEEGAYYVDSINTEFGELRAYLIARLLRDPYCDYDAEMLAFCRAFYGEGGEYIKEFLDEICDNAAKKHSGIYNTMSDTFTLKNNDVNALDELWAKAKDATSDETALANIARSEISWRFVKSSLFIGEFGKLSTLTEENEKLYNDIVASGATTFHEGGGELGLRVSPLYKISGADSWQNPGKNGIYKILYTISAVLYGIALLFSLILFIYAIKCRKWLYCIHFPLLAAFIENIMWSKRAFIAWKDIGEYAITVVIFGLVMLFILYTGIFIYKDSIGKRIAKLLATLVAVFAVYYAPLTIINMVIFNGQANNLAQSITFIMVGAVFVAVCAAALKKFKKAYVKKEN